LVSGPPSIGEVESDEDQTAVLLAECLTSFTKKELSHYSPISDCSTPLSPVAVFNIDTDDSVEPELTVPSTQHVRKFTEASPPSSLIILLDISEGDTAIPHSQGPVYSPSLVCYQSSDTDDGSPPIRKYCVTVKFSPKPDEELGSAPQVHVDIPSMVQSEDPSYILNEEQPSTSRAELTNTMEMIEAVWEARMNAHISDRLAEHKAAIDKKFDAMEPE